MAILSAVQSATNPLTVNLDATRSSDPDGTIVQYFYSFGDATGGVGLSRTTHTYSAPGTYKITLEVTDDSGATTTTSQTVTVTAPPPPPSSGTGSKPPSTLVDLIGKENAYQFSSYLLSASVSLITIGVITSATGVGVEIGLVAIGASLGADVWARFFDSIANDPPDPNFHVLAAETRVKPMHVSAGGALPLAVAGAANALFANIAGTRGAMQAFITSLNRYSGAIQAGDAGAAAMQTAAAARLARKIATGLQRDLALRAALVKALRRAHLNFAVSAAQVRGVLRHRLPAAVLRAFARRGVHTAGLVRLRKALSHVKHARGGSLVSELASPRLAREEQALARWLAPSQRLTAAEWIPVRSALTTPRIRIDTLLSQRGMFPSPSQTAASVRAGDVLVLPERRRV